MIEELPVESCSIDWVISNCVISLSPEKHRVFAEVFRVLKPGAGLLVSDVVAQDLPDWIRQSLELYATCISGAISEVDYLAGLTAAGLEDAQVLERLVYDAPQIAGLIQTDFAEVLKQVMGPQIAITDELVTSIAREVAGKIWSARFYARKPT